MLVQRGNGMWGANENEYKRHSRRIPPKQGDQDCASSAVYQSVISFPFSLMACAVQV
jgi:hypothetical protein